MVKKITVITILSLVICIGAFMYIRGDVIGEVYTYKGNSNADGIEIDEVIVLEKNIFDISQLDIIKNKLIEKQFSGIDIEITGIEKDILTINLIDKEKYVVEYVNMGSSGSKICSDILQYSFLQPESDIKNWPKGLKILVNGESDVESDHFNFSGIYSRKVKSKTLATIKDYGYQDSPAGYSKEYIVNSYGQKFVINPIDDTTEIIISEAVFSEYGFYEGKELYRTNESLLFVMELPEGIPYIIVKLQKGDRTSTWLPTYNGKDGTLVVPAEYEII
jgi:hypothetical protein